MWESIATNSCDVCNCSRSKRRDESFLDRENISQNIGPVKNDDFSFYGSSSPPAVTCTGTSPNHCTHNVIRRPLEDHDPGSRDSGYITNYNGDSGKFSSYASPTRGSSRMSFGSGSLCSIEDEFFEDFSDIEPLEDSNLPQDFGKLIHGPISVFGKNKVEKSETPPKDLAIRPLFRRALSLQNDVTTPNNTKARSCLFKSSEIRPFKRPEPPSECENPVNVKKPKIVIEEEEEEELPLSSIAIVPRPVLQRAFSATEESIMCAVQRSSTEPDLIGDFSKTFCLPLTQGRHQDLKSITPNTLAQLMKGIYSDIGSFKVIDCRYPYEYDGGHIEGAINIYTKDQCVELLSHCQVQEQNSANRHILVFHCEFSSERGPNLCRYLRKQDRQLNQDVYPSLHYPEIYLLEGGYKNFFQQFSHLCVPIAYKEMLHPEHENDLRFFRQKSKTWNVDTRQRPQYRGNLKRLGL